MAIKARLVKAGSSFAFWFFVEMMHDQIIKGLREYLASMHPGDVPEMVRKGEFPSMEHLDFSAVGDYAEHLEKIPLVTLVEYLAEARPDLVKAIEKMGMQGAEYLVNLRLHLLGLVKHPQKALGESTGYKPKEEMVQATCDQCGKSWAVPKSEAECIKECPFCHAV